MEKENKITAAAGAAASVSEEPVVEETMEDKQAEDAVGAEAAKSAEKRCPNCQALLQEGQDFCFDCGVPLKKVCARCGAELQEGHIFCASCGMRVDAVPDNGNQPFNQYNGNFAGPKKRFNIDFGSNQIKNNKKKLPILIAVVCVVILLLVVLLTKMVGGGSFEKKFSDMEHETWCFISSDDSYMTIDTNPTNRDDYFDNDAWNAVVRVNGELGFTNALQEKMKGTSALDGRQSDQNDRYRVSWTYHPDQGLEVTYEKIKK